ncbi:MAG: RluA family pseudouridine synthase [Candidatus Sungbacteria bacterium]|nr:RluA family pseudouridine synthase [Candidatus Sungbacteria bacterium]
MSAHIEIIYSDENLIIVNKPPGISVHGSLDPHKEKKGEQESTLVDFLLDAFPEVKTVGDDPEHRPGIVHRLDKNTSGVMVVARNQAAFLALKTLFQTRQVEKTYWAIVCGRVKNKEGIISYAIGRSVNNPLKRGAVQGSNRIRGAREAVTLYSVLKLSDQYSLVELKPKTGRMHQIRVHMKTIGHPIACDSLYGGKNVCCPEGCSRQLLHASSLSFSYPEGRRFTFEAELPQDFALAEKQLF